MAIYSFFIIIINLISLRAKCHVEVINTSSKVNGRTRNAIVVTEVPYMTNKAQLLEKIADMVNNKKLDGISDLRDESDRQLKIIFAVSSTCRLL